MYVDNQEYYGHLVNSDNYDTSHKHSDLYQIFDNKYVSSIPVTGYCIQTWLTDCTDIYTFYMPFYTANSMYFMHFWVT